MKIIKSIGILLITLAWFCSCDKLNKNEYLKPVGKGIDSTTVKQNVLIEDFTGTRCVNCPEASEIIHVLQAAHGDQIIAIAIHVSNTDIPGLGSADSMICQAGKDLYNRFLPPSLPNGMINRNTFGTSSVLIDKGAWTQKVESLLGNEPLVKLKATSSVSGQNATIVVDAEILKDINKKLNMVVMITEDNIVGRQSTPAGAKLDYVHQHILRAGVSPTFGDFIVDSPNQGQKFSKSYSYALDPKWNVQNCHVVAYLLDADSGEVVQVTQVNIN